MAAGPPSLRAAGLSRVWVLGFSAFWCTALVAVTADEWPVPLTLLVFRALGIAFAATAAYRGVRLGLAVQGDELLVRNLLRTRRVRREEIRRVWLGEPLTAPLPGGYLGGPRGEAINIETATSSFTVDVGRNWWGWRGLHARLVDTVKSLESWRNEDPRQLRGPSQPQLP